MLEIGMNRSPIRQVFALFLGVFVTLGMSLSVAQVGAAPAKMSMAMEMGAPGQGDCHDCGTAGDADGKAMKCKAVCAAPMFIALPQELTSVTLSVRALAPLPEAGLVPGWASPPDPYPPRPRFVG